MTRFSVLARHPRRTLGALAMLLVAVGVAVGSGANFTASAANPSNTFATGTLSIGNTPSSAILTASGMKPGDPASTGTVDIQNTGSVAGTFSLSEDTPVDSDSAHKLSSRLDLTVVDCGPVASADCGAGTTTYTGKLDALTSTSLGSFASNAARRYQFSVSFPSGSGDDDYQGDNTSVAFNWSATS